MNQELTQKLVKRFPVLYQEFYDDMSTTCMCWGFDHGDGWNDIIWQLSLAIEEELGYSWLQTKTFLLKKKWSKKWNKLVYKLSPVDRGEWHHEGTGVKGDPIRQVWDRRPQPDIFGRFFGRIRPSFIKDMHLFQRRWWMLGVYWARLESGLKGLVWHPNTGFAVGQVKEKFGTLRFYSSTTDRISKFISLAERLSAITCEECGKYGELLTTKHGWYYTACKEHDRAKLPEYTIPAVE